MYWNPDRVFFTVPFINWPIYWYGIFFVAGFVAGYWIILKKFTQVLEQSKKFFPRDISNWNQAHFFLFKEKSDKEISQSKVLQKLNALLQSPHRTKEQIIHDGGSAFLSLKRQATSLVDKFSWFVVFGALIGARLGHILFYDWPVYQNNPAEILKTWHGGLASHGGAIGILLGMFIFQHIIRKNYPEFSFLRLLDIIVIPTALAGCCIRLGNFINQEVIGLPTELPWGIIFGNPADASPILPRHPVQLYEAAAYLCIYFILNSLWKAKESSQGFLSGLFFILLFGSRFLIEFLKVPQSLIINETYLQTGQYLSLPFILVGFLCLFYSRSRQTTFC